MATAQEYLKSARQALAEKRADEALRRLAQGFIADVTCKPLYALAAKCLHRQRNSAEARLFEAALADFDSAHPFYELGSHFMETGAPRLALPFLRRAARLAPGRRDVLMELAQAYNQHFRPHKAREILAQLDLSHDFWAAYEFYWASLLCGEIGGIAEFIQDAKSGVANSRIDPDTRGDVESALTKLDEALTRWIAFPHPPLLVRDWHFIQYGAAILHYCDTHEFEDVLEIAGGRWIALWASWEWIARDLHRLRRFLAELYRYPRGVVGLPDRDSEIVARATAMILDRPYLGSAAPLLVEPEMLVVAADNRRLVHPGLGTIQPGQTLFAYNLCWIQDAGPTPDVAGLMSQVCSFPWNGGTLHAVPERGRISTGSPDLRSVELIARDLAATSPLPDPYFDSVLDFYVQRADYLKGGGQRGGLRFSFSMESPVPGRFFE